ncbi:MAG: sigma-70 family RNA polymerase sigma factor [Thermoanaerobaculia bacterium]|nr:sigma-70 family RNA polymerase sigma factor [Thermoanaerobaculia bacterium]
MKTIVKTENRLSQLDDNTLICLVLSGQEEAYTEVVRRYQRLIRHVLQRYLTDPEAVEEVTQDTFLRAFRAMPGFRGDSKLSTWLSRIAISQAISRLRSRKYAAWDSIEDTLAHWEMDLHDSEKALEKQESNRLLRQAIQRLNPNDATALELFYFREQSIEEIGRITGWTATNIKSRLSRARQRLQGALLKEGLHAEYFA